MKYSSKNIFLFIVRLLSILVFVTCSIGLFLSIQQHFVNKLDSLQIAIGISTFLAVIGLILSWKKKGLGGGILLITGFIGALGTNLIIENSGPTPFWLMLILMGGLLVTYHFLHESRDVVILPQMRYIYEIIAIIIGVTISFIVEDFREGRQIDTIQKKERHEIIKDLVTELKQHVTIYQGTQKTLENFHAYYNYMYNNWGEWNIDSLSRNIYRLIQSIIQTLFFSI